VSSATQRQEAVGNALTRSEVRVKLEILQARLLGRLQHGFRCWHVRNAADKPQIARSRGLERMLGRTANAAAGT